MELKKFVNKYREKLVIKSENQLTMVDKLEGKSTKNTDKIDFDYQNFKDSCLSNFLSQKWDGKEVQKIIQKLKRNLLKDFDLTKQVFARVIEEKHSDDHFHGSNLLIGEIKPDITQLNTDSSRSHLLMVDKILSWPQLNESFHHLFWEKRFDIQTADKQTQHTTLTKTNKIKALD